VAAAIAPVLGIDPTSGVTAAIAAYGVAYACVASCVIAVAAMAPDLGARALAIGSVAVVGLAVAPLVSGAIVSAGIVLALLLVCGTAAGAAIGARIEHPGHLLPVAVVSSFADLVSVSTPGAPSDAIAHTPAALSVLAISWPMPGTHDAVPILGVGDVVVAALYVAATRKHGLAIPRTLLALGVGLALTAIVVAATALPIPALPFLGAAVVVAHPEARRLPPKDRRTAAIGLALVVLAMVALVLSRLVR
jgi:hypothetical protein